MKRTLIALLALASLAATAKTVIRYGSPVPRKPYTQEQEDILYWFAVTNAPKLYATLQELREWRAEVLAAEKREKERIRLEAEIAYNEEREDRYRALQEYRERKRQESEERRLRWDIEDACNMIREMYNNPPPPPPGW